MATEDFERAVRIERPDKMTPRSLKMKLSRESGNSTIVNQNTTMQSHNNTTTDGPVRSPVIDAVF